VIGRPVAFALCALTLHAGSHASAQGVQGARTAIAEGRYEEALGTLRRIGPGDLDDAPARRLEARLLSTLGRYEEAERVARQGSAAVPLGEALYARGLRAAAESAFVSALQGGSRDSVVAAFWLARLQHESGQREEANRRFRQFIDLYNRSAATLSSEELMAVAQACEYLGASEPQLFKDALLAYDEAVARDPQNLEASARLGEMFLARYNSADAKKTFDDILRRNPRHVRSLLGEARRRLFDSHPGADSLVTRALDVNPRDVDALLLRAEVQISAEDDREARRNIDAALAVNPSSVKALSLLATLHYRDGNHAGVAELQKRVTALDPRDATLYVTLADLAGRTRRYAQAVDLARHAIAIDPSSWRAHTHLGMNLLRTGKIEPGRASLETAFRGDPYDVWVKNTLDLLDTFGNYDIAETEHFRFMIEKPESRIMSIYLGELAERAYTTFASRYGYRPPEPIRVEVYRSHAEFSVRTVGLSGLGALGVSFGTTVAMDSPAARDFGPFNWGSTLWHEIAHTFTLGATDHRVPRWFSEGLSVYEEHRARPGWGSQVSPSFLDAYTSGKLPKASRLNDGFVRPSYPQQVMFAYYMASLVCDFIARDFGDRAIVDMLKAFREGAGTEAAVRRVLKLEPDAFDRRFDQYVRTRFGHAIAALRDSVRMLDPDTRAEDAVALASSRPGSWKAQMTAASVLLGQRRFDLAIAPLRRAVALFPEFGGLGGPYPLLASAQLAAGDTAGARSTLRTIVATDESDLETHVLFADLSERAGDLASAADALERSMYLQPYDVQRHERLASIYEKLGNRSGAVRERRAVVALDPVDRAGAHYRLALALRDAGQRAEARRAVLSALAEAPDYQLAQELLLNLQEARP
jgi:cellulose synthase operon protein C